MMIISNVAIAIYEIARWKFRNKVIYAETNSNRTGILLRFSSM
jgi:hypothetical protein